MQHGSLPRIAQAGLELITSYEYAGSKTFTNVGAMVSYLHAISWLVPGFSVATHQTQLLELQQRLEHGELLQFTTCSYLIEARKP